MARHIRKGDTVYITAGADRGKTGQVIRVIPKEDRVVVEGVGIRTVHVKPTQANPQGALVKRETPIHISNVSPVAGGKPTRVRFQTKDDGSKVRVAARTGEELGVIRGAKAKA